MPLTIIFGTLVFGIFNVKLDQSLNCIFVAILHEKNNIALMFFLCSTYN